MTQNEATTTTTTTTKTITVRHLSHIVTVTLEPNDDKDTFLEKINMGPKELIMLTKRIDRNIPFYDNFTDGEIVNMGIRCLR